MTFTNEKNTFLAKLDKSKKGSIDERAIPLITTINKKDNYYTTSSCSGRVYLWSGTGKKNETQWIKVSHDPIKVDFLKLDNIHSHDPIKVDFLKLDNIQSSQESEQIIWLRLEAFIMHIACKDINAANQLLEQVHPIFKKSCILTASNKIIVEIRGSEFIEMPIYKDNFLIFSGDLNWLTDLINQKLQKIWLGIDKFEKMME